jgi:Xylose isomerase-like TIM barrel
LRLGTTAFSFTNEWLARRYTLEHLLVRIAELDLGPGIELIGFQAWRSFPHLTRDEIAAFRRLVDELGLEPAALGAYVDLLRRRDRPMTTAEAVEFLRPQIAIAGALGFPLLRLHAGIPAAVLEQTAKVAERTGVILATEVQGGQTPDDPAVTAVLECRDRLGSPNLALALDFSVAMRALPERFVESVQLHGMPPEVVDNLVGRWAGGASTRELFAALAEVDAPAAALDEARSGFIRFGRQEPDAWARLVPQIAYAHAKFWELDAAGDEPTVRNGELIDVLRSGGFGGFVVSEWGGNAWTDVDDVDAFETVLDHHKLLRAVLQEPVVGLPA